MYCAHWCSLRNLRQHSLRATIDTLDVKHVLIVSRATVGLLEGGNILRLDSCSVGFYSRCYFQVLRNNCAANFSFYVYPFLQ